jgi:hypothetical protein
MTRDAGSWQQRQGGRQVKAAAYDDRKRVAGQAVRDTPVASVSRAHEPAVAFGAERARADQHGIGPRAQRMEELAVGDARQRRRAAGDTRPPVDGGDHVHRHERPLVRSALAEVQLLDGLVGRQRSGLGQQPA